MSKNFLLILTCAIFCSAAATATANSAHVETVSRQDDNRIVGGYNANIEDYPHQLMLLYFNTLRCGAVLLKNNIALTAAHCVNSLTILDWLFVTVVAGATFLNERPQVRFIKDIEVHPNYNEVPNDYDVAILILSGEFKYNAKVQPIALTEERPPTDTEVIVTGWGATTQGSTSSQLQVVTVKVTDQDNCNKAYNGGITQRMICAQVPEGGKDSCQGDSGGPLVQGKLLVGLVSWGEGCGLKDYPGVYASIDQFRNWINEHSRLRINKVFK